ncbi:type I restriction endonuclease subunit R [Paenibacillus sp. FSL H7-0331]|uniref:type I restriction endonuclease subunit R n=1 Tax=Paenibacillus sp. FSL H7-0331 TaxID=1920421 RepID=UPI0021168B93|nr:type I restriction endonuclease subunit R [Paenibacillus sp. FSL H7-0331]
MANGLYETDFEETTIERLKGIGYEYLHAMNLFSRTSLNDVVLRDRLEAFLKRTYPAIPDEHLPALASRFADPDGVTLLQRNQRFHEMLAKGIDFSCEEEGKQVFHHVYPINWDNLLANDFLVVNQLSIEGKMARRPDLIIFINGLPLVVFELKSPYSEQATIEYAYNQITNYTYDISQLFNYNAFSVISDGIMTLHGIPGAPYEYYSAWKSIDGKEVDNQITNSMRTMIQGMFPKERLLAYIRNFIVFMKDGNKEAIKIAAKYHQFFGVQFSVEHAVRATRPEGDRRIGVLWHATGSGKSLSMLFFSGILSRHPEMDNPTIVIQVDRADLDGQLHETFLQGASLVGNVHHAENANELRELLRNEAGQIIFSTIEKFRLKDGEGEFPVCSERRNIVVISDEAHRTQYSFDGFAGNLRRALPNASHVGFTGTPITFADRNTFELFGNVIHIYDMQQATLDGATLRIYYESRLIPLDLENAQLDDEFKQIISQVGDGKWEEQRAKWAALEKVVGTSERIETLAKDIVSHFAKAASLEAKGMIVCMSREICAALYEKMRVIDGCPPIEIVMTGDIDKDPPSWREKQLGSNFSHIKSKEEQESVKAKLRDPDDPLKFVIVRDMWLTGTDIPPLTYLYVDKPIKGHGLIQAIARVNRVYPGKMGGVVIDYIGIAEALKEATHKYTQGGGKGKPASDIEEEAVPIFFKALESVRAFVPPGIDVTNWRSKPKVEREDWIADFVGYLMGPDENVYLNDQAKLDKAYQLVKHLPIVLTHSNEVLLYEITAIQIKKFKITGGSEGKPKNIAEELKKLIDRSIGAREEAVDLFEKAGLEKPDISILDESFLADFEQKPHVDLRLKLLQKLLEDEVFYLVKQKNTLGKALSELLEKTINDYHNRVITATAVAQMMVEAKKKIDEERKKKEALGLSDEEMAFYYIIENMGNDAFSNDFIAGLIRKVVTAMKKEFQIDWTNSHRQDVLAKVSNAVKLVLIREQIKGEQLRFLTNAIVNQAKEKYKGWPIEA